MFQNMLRPNGLGSPASPRLRTEPRPQGAVFPIELNLPVEDLVHAKAESSLGTEAADGVLAGGNRSGTHFERAIAILTELDRQRTLGYGGLGGRTERREMSRHND